MRKDSRKLSRINEEVRRELSNIIRNELKDPDIGLVTSVTGVSVTTDLKECNVYVSVLGDEETVVKTLAALERARGFMRHCLAGNLNLRNTPELKIVRDDSIEHGMHIDDILSNLTYENTED